MQHLKVLPSVPSMLVALLVVSSPAAAFASSGEGNPTQSATTHAPSSGGTDVATAVAAKEKASAFTPDQMRQYAERSQRSPDLREYEGGDAIVITSGAVLIAALIVVLLVVV